MSDHDEAFARLGPALQRLGLAWERVEPLAGDVSSRRYFRVWGPSERVVACLYPEPFDEGERAVDRWRRLCAADPSLRLGFASDPVAFLETTHWLRRAGVPVPRIVGIAGEWGCILLEDVGDRSLERALPSLTPEEMEGVYARALNYVARIQGTTEDAIRERVLASCLRLDEEKLDQELSFLARVTLDSLGDEARTLLEEARPQWRLLAQKAATPPFVLCHRDYHARNLFLRRGELVLLDHQDMRLGHRRYDALSLIWDPYVELAPSLRDRLLDAAGVKVDAEVAAVACQRLLKAMGTYLNVVRRRPSMVFVHAARRAIGFVRDMLPMVFDRPAAIAGLCDLWEQGLEGWCPSIEVIRSTGTPQGDHDGGKGEESG